jgi:hypothetical protein
MIEDDKRATQIAKGLPPVQPTHDDDVESQDVNIRVHEPTAMEVFFAWEKLRLVYNAVLILIVLLVMRQAIIDCIEDAIVGAICANLMFSSGPVIESYLSWCGVPRIVARGIIFSLGLFFASVVTTYAVLVAQRP